ncbi:MAG: MoxR family ATPase [Proteobacteria bacterium]|jgi:MoxR-like ATPase|nr:MoxR family ATPase [Pseudomonadota bacterium]
MNPEVARLTELIKQEGAFLKEAQEEVAKIVVGQRVMVERILMGLLTGGHVLLEGLPGLAKTLTVKSVARVLDVNFSRVQFTPDLLPSDLTGTMIFNQKSGDFSARRGPVFTNILLADEINRAPAKVQAALLECMGEKQVTIGDQTYRLEEPFLVLATQNPIEQEGTYPLPEAQMDRFMFKVQVNYPNRAEEMRVLETQSSNENPTTKAVAHAQQILKARSLCSAIYMDKKVKDYILDIVFATREPEGKKGLEDLKRFVSIGASPRATISLARASKAKAFLEGRGFVTPDDVKSIAADVLRHRIILSFEAEAEDVNTQTVIRKVLSTVAAP